MTELDYLIKGNEKFYISDYVNALYFYQMGKNIANNETKFIFETNINLCEIFINLDVSQLHQETTHFNDVFKKYQSLVLSHNPSLIDYNIKLYNKFNVDTKEDLLISVIMPTWNRADIIGEAIESLILQKYQNWELLVCDDGSEDDTKTVVEGYNDPRIKYFLLDKSNGAIARNHGITKSKGDIIAFLDSDNIWSSDYLKFIVSAHKLCKSPVVYTGFYDVTLDCERISDSAVKFTKFNFKNLAWRNFVDLNTLSVRRSVILDSGLFDPNLQRQQDWDLMIRLGSKYAFYGIDLPLVLYRRNKEWNQVTETQKNIDTRTIILEKYSGFAEKYNDALVKNNIKNFYKNVKKNKAPSLSKIAIKISAPNEQVAHSWGDYHFANQLGKGLFKLGFEYAVHCQDQWYEPGYDINIVLRGRHRFITEKSDAKFNILWIISHPDRLANDEFEDYNHIYVASDIFADKVKRVTSVPCNVLHQATDPAIFNSVNEKIDLPSPLIFVGNSRKEYRTLVKWSIEQNLPLSVWGKNWEEFIDDKYIVGEYIPNSQVSDYYASASILLNDHWDSMKNNGFISNRIFDASASGAFIISDAVKGLDVIFGDAIVTVESPQELQTQYDYYMNNEQLRLKKARKAQDIVLNSHTFFHRAQTIVSMIRSIH